MLSFVFRLDSEGMSRPVVVTDPQPYEQRVTFAQSEVTVWEDAWLVACPTCAAEIGDRCTGQGFAHHTRGTLLRRMRQGTHTY